MVKKLCFEYALKFPNGTYYTGRVNSEARPNYWQGAKHEAFTYTIEGAYRKKDSMDCFKDCTVIHML